MKTGGIQRDGDRNRNSKDRAHGKDSRDSLQVSRGDRTLAERKASADDASLELSTGTGLFDGSLCFVLDDGGRYVLDSHGSPARMKRWEPINSCQRERYTRLHHSTEGPTATRRWLRSVLISPDHLGISTAQEEHGRGEFEGSKAFGKFSSSAGGSTGLVDFGRENGAEVTNHLRLHGSHRGQRKGQKQLDGFLLMEACCCELPDEGLRADVSGKGLLGVVQEDLKYFVRLEAVDAGDNHLAFDSFATLPQLKDLFLPCNNIRDIRLEDRSYPKLLHLDLSYNNLTADALSALGRLPNLLDLDLTCNGLTLLPPGMSNLRRLQKLSLERNQLESEKVFEVLSKLPVLRELNLAFNYFTAVRYTPDLAGVSFALLEDLDLGFNYIGHEAAIEGLALLERLQRIVLYGNPLAGRTGEDPSGTCVEEFIDRAERVRRGWARTPIEVITEMPRKRPSHGGGGRRRPYSDIGLTMIDEKRLPPVSAFRDAGNESLFRFEPSDSSARRSGAEISQHVAQKCCQRETRERDSSRPRASSSVFLTSLGRQDGEGDVWSSDQGVDCTPELAVVGDNPECISTRQLLGPLDPVIQGNPVKLRMAMTALRYTLRHPVTSSMDVICQGRGGSGIARSTGGEKYNRKTAAARARQLPRRPYEPRNSREGICAGLFDESPVDGDLDKVEKVLTSMGDGTIDAGADRQGPEDNTLPHRRGLSSIIRIVTEVLDESEY